MARRTTSKTGTPEAQAQSERVQDSDEQPKGTGEPNGDEAAVADPGIDSAGEQKEMSDRDPELTDESVVTSAVQSQKSVGVQVPDEEAPISKEEQASSPVSMPNGTRSNTFTTPPRVAVEGPQQDADGQVPDEPETVDGVPVSAAGAPLSTNGTHAPHNGVVAPANHANGGIIPDATHAETDGTFMPGGGPNEALTGELAPTGDYTGELTNPTQRAELRVAPVSAPVGKAENGVQVNGPERPSTTGTGVTLAVNSKGGIIDARSGEVPNVATLFERVGPASDLRRCTVRLVDHEPTQNTRRLLLPKGATVSSAQARRICARIEQQQQ